MVEIVNYKVTVQEPDGGVHVNLFQTGPFAEMFALEMAAAPGWGSTTEVQRFSVGVDSVVTVRNSHVEVTGPVQEIGVNGKTGTPVLRVVNNSRTEWWQAWHVLSVAAPESE